jgi:hypothetical protein
MIKREQYDLQEIIHPSNCIAWFCLDLGEKTGIDKRDLIYNQAAKVREAETVDNISLLEMQFTTYRDA